MNEAMQVLTKVVDEITKKRDAYHTKGTNTKGIDKIDYLAMGIAYADCLDIIAKAIGDTVDE